MHSAVLAGLLVAAAVSGLAASATATQTDDELAKVKAELARTRSELDDTRSMLQKLADKVEQLENGASGGAIAAGSGPRIAPVNADNPAISFVVDTTLSSGDLDPGWNFALLESGSVGVELLLRNHAVSHAVETRRRLGCRLILKRASVGGRQSYHCSKNQRDN